AGVRGGRRIGFRRWISRGRGRRGFVFHVFRLGRIGIDHRVGIGIGLGRRRRAVVIFDRLFRRNQGCRLTRFLRGIRRRFGRLFFGGGLGIVRKQRSWFGILAHGRFAALGRFVRSGLFDRRRLTLHERHGTFAPFGRTKQQQSAAGQQGRDQDQSRD